MHTSVILVQGCGGFFLSIVCGNDLISIPMKQMLNKEGEEEREKVRERESERYSAEYKRTETNVTFQACYCFQRSEIWRWLSMFRMKSVP